MSMIVKSIVVAAGALAFTATVAGADVVCNEDGDCWRVRERVEYGPELKLRVFPNDWKWEDKEKDRYRWRDAPEGNRGYYRQGVWIELPLR